MTNIRGYIIHRIHVLRDAIDREEKKLNPDVVVITAFINRRDELEKVLSECRT